MYGLKRHFSPLTLLLLSVNGTVGSAWLFAPLYAAKIAGSGAMIAWIIGGILTILIAITFAELSSLLPIAGGSTRISDISHGAFTSFFMSWMVWISSVTVPTLEVQAVIQYSSTYMPELTNVIDGIAYLTTKGYILATCLMLLLTILNSASFKGFVGFNYLLFAFKIGVILLAIVCLIGYNFHIGNFKELKSSHGIHYWINILSAVSSGGIVFAFTGFKHGVELAGESKNPSIGIPIAIVGSVFVCLLLYLGLQVAFIGALDPIHLRAGWEHLTFPGEAGPFVGLALLLGMGILAKLLYIDAAVSPLGAGLVFATSTARLIYALGKIRFLPTFLTKVNKQNLPANALIFNFLVGMFLFLPLPGWSAMAEFMTSAIVFSYALGPIAVLCFRKELANEKRTFKLPFPHITCFLALFACNLIGYWSGWDTLSKLMIALIIGIILFAFACLTGRFKSDNFGWRAMAWVIPYFLGVFIISYLGVYKGGHGILPFGWDMLVIALFSALILWLGVETRSKKIATRFDHFKHSDSIPVTNEF